jgi:hypothetical protein
LAYHRGPQRSYNKDRHLFVFGILQLSYYLPLYPAVSLLIHLPKPVLPWQEAQCFVHTAFPVLRDAASDLTGLVIFEFFSGTGHGLGFACASTASAEKNNMTVKIKLTKRKFFAFIFTDFYVFVSGLLLRR